MKSLNDWTKANLPNADEGDGNDRGPLPKFEHRLTSSRMKELQLLSLRGALTLQLIFATAACGYSERAGDFTYSCQQGVYGVDGPSCELYLTEQYVLRYGEGSGDSVVLAFAFVRGQGSVGFIDALGDDIVRRIGLDERVLVIQTGDGRIFVAPARPERFPAVVGPLTQSDFEARYPNAPTWRYVQ